MHLRLRWGQEEATGAGGQQVELDYKTDETLLSPRRRTVERGDLGLCSVHRNRCEDELHAAKPPVAVTNTFSSQALTTPQDPPR